MKTTTIKDSRINRDHCAGEYLEMCHEFVKESFGIEKNFKGHCMSWDNFKTTGYRNDYKDVQVDCIMDFNANIITITIK